MKFGCLLTKIIRQLTIREKYPNESDALKRDAECFTVWREHTAAVQERLHGQLKAALELGTVEAYEVAGEYLQAAAGVAFLPPEGYAESLKTFLANLEK